MKYINADDIIPHKDRGAETTKTGRAGRRLMSVTSNSAELLNGAPDSGGLRENIPQTVYNA